MKSKLLMNKNRTEYFWHDLSTGMRFLTVLILLFLSVSDVRSKPWCSVSSGLDMSYLYWEHGGDCVWGFQTAFGPRLFGDLYFRAKVTIPIPFFVIIGNQMNIGGEFSYLPVNPEQGFAVETSLGAAWSLMWPEDLIVILADGESTDPPREEAYDGANGIRLEALCSLGYKFGRCGFWLDLGADHRIMEVTRTVSGASEEGNYTFTGPHIGLTCDVYF